MTTFPSGTRFWPLDPRPEEVFFRDIAHALSHECRWGGHVATFYSVAEHCVRAAWLSGGERHPDDLEITRLAGHRWWDSPDRIADGKLRQRQALLHDATEAYLKDMPRPVKRHLAEYGPIEQRLWEVIAARYGVPVALDPQVLWADEVMLQTERRDLTVCSNLAWKDALEAQAKSGGSHVEPLPERLIPWSPETARNEFLRMGIETGVPEPWWPHIRNLTVGP